MTSFGANIIREGGFMPTCKLQAFFHANNAVVNMFKTALERMPSDTHKFVIERIVPQQVNMCEAMHPPLMMFAAIVLAIQLNHETLSFSEAISCIV
ncbi:hypothetical protein EVAR_91762_1 [Eumeta japonica]|uniref:Uncharacterized protein n=1 Tax=Eumeta variegata TaxID=151549 RepID=A0A4C1SIH5_EUMVA|nr:hypothetical protein EVAR_91762_1 [Eumeta japonica]